MGWQTQSGEELLYALTFAIVYGLAFAAVWALHSLGGWPAASPAPGGIRRPPQSACAVGSACRSSSSGRSRWRGPIRPRNSGGAARQQLRRLACTRRISMLSRRTCARHPSKSRRSKAAWAFMQRKGLPSAATTLGARGSLPEIAQLELDFSECGSSGKRVAPLPHALGLVGESECESAGRQLALSPPQCRPPLWIGPPTYSPGGEHRKSTLRLDEPVFCFDSEVGTFANRETA